ncbi:MAG: alpha-galactosidase [Oscillospiraceae bacterium]|nr:alpha-galactosidase [Oscillospiraceae bacterium]
MLHYNAEASAAGRLERFLKESFRPGTSLPFSFTYDGKSSRELLTDWTFEATGDGVSFTAPDGLRAAVELRTFEDFDAVEWLLTFENTADKTSALLQDVNALDLYVETAPFRTAGTRQYGALDNILYYSGGSDCKADDFIPCQEILHHISAREEMSFGSMHGRPTSGSHGSFPYFNLKTLNCGVFFAIGWSGQWAMTLRTRQQETPGAATAFRFTGGMPGVSTVLYPGEKIRTARILLMPWDGEIGDSNNLSRRFLLKYHTPHVDGKPAVLPLSLQSWGHDEQRGKAEIDEGVRSGLPFDTYWTDAGWYGPAGSHCDDPLCNDWSDNVGWYSHDPLRYPGGEGAVGNYAHEKGLRYLLWLEPDRAVEGTPNITEHPEFYLKKTTVANSHMLNLGREDAYNWALEMLSDKIANCPLDIMRIDYNIGPLASWQEEDTEDRRGMTEIRAVENFYRLWAELRRRFPHLLIDNCASGGRRLDFEANTHSVSLFRTDYLCYADSDATGMQLQTAGLAPFVPLNGLVFKCFDGNPTWYDFLSYLAPGFALTPALLKDLLADESRLAMMRRMLQVLLRVRPLFCGDFYCFTSVTLDERDWFAYQLNLPEEGKACVFSARRSQCAMGAAVYALKGLEADAIYRLEDAETDTVLGEIPGAELMTKGLCVTLPEKETASLIFVTKI